MAEGRHRIFVRESSKLPPRGPANAKDQFCVVVGLDILFRFRGLLNVRVSDFENGLRGSQRSFSEQSVEYF